MERLEFKQDRDPKWNDKIPRMVYQMALLGLTDQQMADIIGVDRSAFSAWKVNKPEFLEALSEGKTIADAKVAESLYKCATGYEYEEEAVSSYKGVPQAITVKKYKGPEAWAAYRWLSTRQSDVWKDTTKVDVKNVNFNLTKIDLTGLSFEELALAEKIGIKSLSNGSDGATE